MKKIDSVFYSDEWAAIALRLYGKQIVQKMPLSGRVFFFHNPHIFVEYCSINPSRYYSERWKFSLPENACDEYEELIYFVETLISSGNKLLAGNIVGKIPGEEDGARLSKKTRELLQYVDDIEFDDAVISGIIYMSGGRTVTDGTDQEAIADKYDKDASELELFYPHAAYILRGLSRFYKSEGKQDYVESEICEY